MKKSLITVNLTVMCASVMEMSHFDHMGENFKNGCKNNSVQSEVNSSRKAKVPEIDGSDSQTYLATSLFGGSRFLTHEELRKEFNEENQRMQESQKESGDKEVAELENQTISSESVVQERVSENAGLRRQFFEGEIIDMVRTPEMDLSQYEGFPNLNTLIIKANQLSHILRYRPNLSAVTHLKIINDGGSLDTIELSRFMSLTENLEKLDIDNYIFVESR